VEAEARAYLPALTSLTEQLPGPGSQLEAHSNSPVPETSATQSSATQFSKAKNPEVHSDSLAWNPSATPPSEISNDPQVHFESRVPTTLSFQAIETGNRSELQSYSLATSFSSTQASVIKLVKRTRYDPISKHSVLRISSIVNDEVSQPESHPGQMVFHQGTYFGAAETQSGS
jgi:hypothetical protein